MIHNHLTPKIATKHFIILSASAGNGEFLTKVTGNLTPAKRVKLAYSQDGRSEKFNVLQTFYG